MLAAGLSGAGLLLCALIALPVPRPPSTYLSLRALECPESPAQCHCGNTLLGVRAGASAGCVLTFSTALLFY